MARRWSARTEFRSLRYELRELSRNGFQRRVAPLLSIIAGEVVETAGQGLRDRAGIDYVRWGHKRDVFDIAIQCKGFEIADDELSADQARQCEHSVDSFMRSGFTTRRYLLVHNRSGRQGAFRERVATSVAALEAAGVAESAEVISLDAFLDRIFDAIYDRLVVGLRRSTQPDDVSRPILDQVPFSAADITVSQHSLGQSSASRDVVDDPTNDLLQSGEGSLSLLLGEFGFGKTTLLERIAGGSVDDVVFIEGAWIDRGVQGTKDLLVKSASTDWLVEQFPSEAEGDVRRIARAVIDVLLQNPEAPTIVIIDGLDESEFLSRAKGLGRLFEMLRLVRVPVVLACRTEYWKSLLEDFTAVLERLSTKDESKKRVVCRLIELREWETPQIRSYISLCRDRLQGAPAQRLGQLEELVRLERYHEIYGDIPRRPLFLGMLTEHVAEVGLEPVGMAALVDAWIRQKIRRDVLVPVAKGYSRVGIAPGATSIQVTMDIAYQAMKSAALLMTDREGDELLMYPSCAVGAVTSGVAALRESPETIGLFLNSLLLPAPPVRGVPHLRFAHRAFQEYFLALAVAEDPDVLDGCPLPPTVTTWHDRIASEGLLAH